MADKTRALGAVLLLAAVVVAIVWIAAVAQKLPPSIFGAPERQPMKAILIPVGIGFLAILGLLGWIGWTMATMKVEVPTLEEKKEEEKKES
jgi:protein-S-isoprenylcysteine O-methyltransferase Ste14